MIFLRTLKSGLRHLLSQKLNSAVHIAGLSLGMTVCLLIGMFIRFQTSFDTYHPNADRTYTINMAWTEAGNRQVNYSTPLPLFDALRQHSSGLEHIAFAHPMDRNLIDIAPDKRFEQEYVMISDPAFFDVFKVEVVKGKGRETLGAPYQALITESTARKFFGDEDPIGKTFRYRSRYDYTVGGVIQDMPANTHLPATMILSFVAENAMFNGDLTMWMNTSGTTTYFVAPEGYGLSTLQAQLDRFCEEHINNDPNLPKFVKASFEIAPMLDIHFAAETGGSCWVPAFNTVWLWFFGSIGAAVLVLACINFINLSTAQALTRAKEVGVRKSIGAGRSNLLMQFLGESWILAAVAGVIAVGATELSLPFVNTLLETGIQSEFTTSPIILITLITGILLVGLMAGIYPAWIITRFSAATSLRSGFNTQGDRGSSWLRRSLVVIQFTVSAGLLIALALISQQVEFIRSKDLGFDRDNILVVKMGKRGESPVFANELEKIPGIESWSFCSAGPTSEDHWGTQMSATNRDDPNRKSVTLILADEAYAKLYNLDLLAGRYHIPSDTNFISDRLPADQMVMKAVVNETVIHELGISTPEEAIGRHFWFGMGNGDIEIVGVVGDFNTRSLHEAMRPAIIGQLPAAYNHVSVKFTKGSNIPQTIASIEAAWKLSYPNGVFAFNFLNDQIDQFYKSEARIFDLFKIFSGLAMLISCLGLWGLITLTAQKRMKEIGIRKVLGATAPSLMVLLSKDFVYMVLAALVIAGPLVHYGITQWLNAFAFKVPIGWQAFALAGLASLGLALITVGFQALRAAFTNPASILKSE